MARFEHLHIYKEAYNLAIILFGVVSKFSRDYKYTLGDKILFQIINILENIFIINSSKKQDREEYFLNIEKNIFHLTFLLNLSNDLKLFGKQSIYISCFESLVKIKKMKTGWQNFL